MSARARAPVEDARDVAARRTRTSSFAALFALPRAGASVDSWHVSPAIDLAAYAFSWLWILVPLVLLGSAEGDYVLPYLAVMAVTGVHRHIGLPYVYLDAQVRRRHPVRFTLFPAVMFALWAASPWLAERAIVLPSSAIFGLGALLVLLVHTLRRDGAEPAEGASAGASAGFRAPMLLLLALAALALTLGPRIDRATASSGFAIRPVLDIVALIAGVWNIWHVYMQKYGILRMYSAKADGPRKVSGHVDRFLLLAWMPLYFAWLGPRHRRVILESFGGEDGVLLRVLDVLARIEPVAVPIGFATVAIALVAWAVAEHRASRFANAPRLLMATGTTALASCFLFLDPVKVYLAFGFSHAVEYMVFVWAFQRRRYHQPLPHAPMLGRILKHPVVAYLGFIVVVGAAFLFVKFYGTTIARGAKRPEAFGHPLAEWAYYWGIYQSMVHFYFDGFLWKMRHTAVRASI